MLVTLSALLLGACAQPVMTRETENHMGTTINIMVVSPASKDVHPALGAAFAEFRRLDELLSNYREDSEVSTLNRDGTLSGFSEDLRVNLQKSIQYGRLTEGAFDITVQPELDLYSQSFEQKGRPPTAAKIADALRLVDYRRIRIEENRIVLGPGQSITLGGIAKGYAVDRALETLRKHGIRRALVDAGGDIGTLGSRGQGLDWVVALRNPRQPRQYVTRIRAAGTAVVTSGDYERYFDEQRSFHHIVDPRTGYSATELISVTVVAGDAFDADAISTAVFVLGAKRGLNLVESMDGVEALVITREREILRSSGFARHEM
jgi:thiamine biosynthesis lipoprotein